MPEYRRPRVAGATVFLTLVAYGRRKIFDEEPQIQALRDAIKQVQSEWPFEIEGAVILPDHLHFLWSLPLGDSDFSKRAGRFKALATKRLLALPTGEEENPGRSRRRHNEAAIWQRRFWDHVIRDERDFERHLDYIHYNPVKHGHAACPHEWRHSSFDAWVNRGAYSRDWGCRCESRTPVMMDFSDLDDRTGE